MLSKSSAKIKEKVCHVESLHVSLADFIDPLFTFGKGFMARKHPPFPTTATKTDLMAIPEKAEEMELKPKAFERKPGVLEVKPAREGQGWQTAVRVDRVPFEEKGNKTIKENLSPPMKRELNKGKKCQLSMVQAEPKTAVKPRGHVKHASTLK